MSCTACVRSRCTHMIDQAHITTISLQLTSYCSDPRWIDALILDRTRRRLYRGIPPHGPNFEVRPSARRCSHGTYTLPSYGTWSLFMVSSLDCTVIRGYHTPSPRKRHGLKHLSLSESQSHNVVRSRPTRELLAEHDRIATNPVRYPVSYLTNVADQR
jgi:hypothetical protein